jgi:hypothetical protein
LRKHYTEHYHRLWKRHDFMHLDHRRKLYPDHNRHERFSHPLHHRSIPIPRLHNISNNSRSGGRHSIRNLNHYHQCTEPLQRGRQPNRHSSSRTHVRRDHAQQHHRLRHRNSILYRQRRRQLHPDNIRFQRIPTTLRNSSPTVPRFHNHRNISHSGQCWPIANINGHNRSGQRFHWNRNLRHHYPSRSNLRIIQPDEHYGIGLFHYLMQCHSGWKLHLNNYRNQRSPNP